jgi:hypothetical protein
VKVTVTFDTDVIFIPEYQAVVCAYFRRELTAGEAAKQIGFSREAWERHFAAIFAKGNSEIAVGAQTAK